MRKQTLCLSTALAAALLPGGCGRGGGGGANGAMERGEWETTVRISNVRIDNLPDWIRRDLQRMPADRTQTARGCWPMTADRVRIENLRFTPPELDRPGPECEVPELVMEGGRLSARLRCTGLPGPPEGEATMTVTGELDGSYTAASLQATASGEVSFGAHSGSADLRITSRRLGPGRPRPRYGPPPYGPDPDAATNMAAPMAVPVPPAPPPRLPAPADPLRGLDNRM